MHPTGERDSSGAGRRSGSARGRSEPGVAEPIAAHVSRDRG